MKLQTAEIFGDKMVLQLDKPVKIWGHGNPKEQIIVEIQNIKATTEVDEQAKWMVILPPLAPSENETMIISSETDTLYYHDIMVGEVWIAGGQSNMEFYMRYDKDYQKEIEICENSKIRFFDYPKVSTEKSRKMRDYSSFGYWRECNKENLDYYSAVAYYFAKDLQKNLNVPIGIVGCNCGGTKACCWMDEATLAKHGKIWVEDYENGLKAIPDLEQAEREYMENPMTNKGRPFDNPISERTMYGIPKEELIEILANLGENYGNLIGPWHEWRPNGLYHTMLENVFPYTAQGVIWYQGESDENHPEIYADLLCDMIELWREKWGIELPFLMTQLAPLDVTISLGGTYYPILREQQEEVTGRMRQVYCASIGDVGNACDIHPKEKRPVGERLALLARGHVYGEDVLCEAPKPSKIEREEKKVSISFLNTGGKLYLKGNRIQALKVVEENVILKEERDYKVSLENERIEIIFPVKVPKQIQVLFAKDPYYEVNLYNSSHIPMKPFSLEV